MPIISQFRARRGSSGGVAAAVPVTWNPSDKDDDFTLSSGDLVATSANNTNEAAVRGTLGRNTGKYYFEVVATTIGNTEDWAAGLATGAANLSGQANLAGSGYHVLRANGTAIDEDATLALTSLSAGQVLGVAADLDAGLYWFSRQNVWLGTPAGDPAAGTNQNGTFTGGATMYPVAKTSNKTTASVWTLRTAAASFTGTIPTGFSAWAD